jgi:hypothetical protein
VIRRPSSAWLFAAALFLGAPRLAAAEPFTRATVAVGGGRIDLSTEEVAGAGTSRAEVERWVRRAAHAVFAFYGRFPVARVRVVVHRVPGRGVHGTAFGAHLIRMRVGVEATPAQLERDWAMTHEMLHLAFPDLERRHLWMQEGLSTYFEPIARARVGQLTAEQVWRELFEGLPKGLPRDGEGGLDQTPSWGATYWGGALFWFLADVEIRRETGNRRSADDVLRAVLAAGGDGSQLWKVERVLALGDRVTGTSVMTRVYDRLARRRFAVDLADLRARLGVGARFPDRAPLANVRRAITARVAARCLAGPGGARRPPSGASSVTPCPAYRRPYATPDTPDR